MQCFAVLPRPIRPGSSCCFCRPSQNRRPFQVRLGRSSEDSRVSTFSWISNSLAHSLTYSLSSLPTTHSMRSGCFKGYPSPGPFLQVLWCQVRMKGLLRGLCLGQGKSPHLRGDLQSLFPRHPPVDFDLILGALFRPHVTVSLLAPLRRLFRGAKSRCRSDFHSR